MNMRFKGGVEKAVTLSYDDGVIDDKRLIAVMDKYGLKGTFNINTGMYCPEDAERQWRRMTRNEAIELYTNSGHEVAVHTYTHPFLERIPENEMFYEVIEDRRNITRDFKTAARGMAYPMGTYDDKVIDVLKKCGICYSRTVKSTEDFGLPKDWLEWHPTCHHKNPKLMEMAERFINEKTWRDARVFYLWGHSYEYFYDNNWEVIEEFAELIGGREDIWYATNIEIYDYVKAYEGLQTDYEKKIIHNPSVLDVWFEKEMKIYCVKPGETLYL